MTESAMKKIIRPQAGGPAPEGDYPGRDWRKLVGETPPGGDSRERTGMHWYKRLRWEWYPAVQVPGTGLALVSTIAPALGISVPYWLLVAGFAVGLLMIAWPLLRSIFGGLAALVPHHHDEPIQIYLDPATDGVLQIPNTDGVPTKWAQISIAAKDRTLMNCEVRLKSVIRTRNGNSGELVEEHVHCNWSQHSGKKMTIRPGLPERANLFTLVKGLPGVFLQLEPQKVTLSDAIQTPGRFRGRIIVIADNIPAQEQEFDFEWRDFERVTMELVHD